MGVKISLGIDNCFASKRWTRPEDWMPLIRDLGLNIVEASADTECDPLYRGKEYLDEWVSDVKWCSEKTGVYVTNLYSGHGTYSTLGLAHTEDKVRLRFREEWVKVHMQTALKLGAGMGFFAHAIDDAALQDKSAYARAMVTLYADLADIALYAKQTGLKSISLEQMYSPHQPPWTLDGTKKLMNAVYNINSAPMYITIDVGHMNGQQYFIKPSEEKLLIWLEKAVKGEYVRGMWLGPKAAREKFTQAAKGEIEHNAAVKEIIAQWNDYGYMFAQAEDGSVTEWLSRFACYSPIIHLQQSDGKSSPHWPFSPETNKNGIIDARDVLIAALKAYENPSCKLPVCEHITFTLEPFIGTAANIYDALYDIEQSIKYWRKYIPYDNMPLEEAAALAKADYSGKS